MSAALIAAFAGLLVLVSAQPAAAAPAHKPYSDGTAQRVAAVRTVLAPTATYNNNALNPGLCRSDNWISEYPTWTVSNVTSSSAYLHSLKITYKPGRNMTLGGGSLVDGNGKNVGNYFNYVSITPAGYTKTWTFNKTVSFGSNKQLHFMSLFNPGNSGESALCIGDGEVWFHLRPI
ncbi:hypothetical protein Drose_25990 [Dactylosporangium roseum]|uniref:Secreted protein n=1 Tax=Dactylosporangium roseum TaxID=47989 RepID=A0ABY5YY42_9ACTN|nr:hypothetical protein [Dactylosporangium roseum]UWZ34658.1 hypothetical protein Drose_25990 [Dactylosporangium roseum]